MRIFLNLFIIGFGSTVKGGLISSLSQGVNLKKNGVSSKIFSSSGAIKSEDKPEPRSHVGFCLSANEACMLQGTFIPVHMLYSFNETYNTIGCAERCEQDPSCEVWTWHGDSKQCQIFSNCPPKFRYRGCQDCQTGNRSCGLWESNEVVVSGGLGPQDSQPNQATISVIGMNSTINSTLSMPRSRWGHVSAFIGFNYYVCGGSTELDGLIAPNDTCDIYEAASRQWIGGEPLLEPRHGAAGLEIFGKLYILGGLGIDGSYLRSIEHYEPTSRKWEKSCQLELHIGLVGHCAIAIKDGFFVAGGEVSEGNVTGEAAFFNLTSNQWTTFTPMNAARGYHGCSVHLRSHGHLEPDVEVMVTGGIGYLSSEKIGVLYPLKSVEIFNLRTKTWRWYEDLPEPRAYHSQQNMMGTTSLFGGVVGQNITAEIIEKTSTSWKTSQLRLKAATRSASLSTFPTDLVH